MCVLVSCWSFVPQNSIADIYSLLLLNFSFLHTDLYFLESESDTPLPIPLEPVTLVSKVESSSVSPDSPVHVSRSDSRVEESETESVNGLAGQYTWNHSCCELYI